MDIPLELLIAGGVVLALLLLVLFLAARKGARSGAQSRGDPVGRSTGAVDYERLAAEVAEGLREELSSLERSLGGIEGLQVRAERTAKGHLAWTVMLGITGGAGASAWIQKSVDRPWASRILEPAGLALPPWAEPMASVALAIVCALVATAVLLALMHWHVEATQAVPASTGWRGAEAGQAPLQVRVGEEDHGREGGKPERDVHSRE